MAGGRVADQVGRVLGGRYRLVAPVGTGGSAHVYVADDTTLRRRVAVKVLQPALALDQAFLRRFRAEAQAAAALNHPNVMRVFDWGEDDEGPFLVLEFLEGGSLRDMLDSGRRLSISQAVLVGLEAARALDYAHRRGLVHRDLKPANLLFDEEGRTAIADFGLARALAEAAWTEPEGVLLGTARYASPEAAMGRSVDGKADVYGLGLVLLEAVTGDPPPVKDTTVATLMARANEPIVAPYGLGALGPIIDAAGAVDPDDRPDAADLAVMLDAAARQLDAPAPLPITTVLNLDARAPSMASDPTEMGQTAVLPAAGPAPKKKAQLPDDAPVPGRQSRRRISIVVLALIASAAIVSAVLYVPTILKPEHVVPKVLNQELASAQRELGALNYRVVVTREYSRDVGNGHVIKQDPEQGVKRREDTTIRLVVSKGFPPKQVPGLNDLTEAQARQLIIDSNFEVGEVTPRDDENVPEGEIIDWNPKGRQAEKTKINLVVSGGPPARTISNWTNKPFAEAKAAIESVGLKVKRVDGYSDSVAVGNVISTSPGAGQTAEKGSTVTITVSIGPNTVSVPSLNGLTRDQARTALEGAGLKLGAVYGPNGGNRRVFLQSPGAGAKVARGTAVSIYVQ